jgi:integrase
MPASMRRAASWNSSPPRSTTITPEWPITGTTLVGLRDRALIGVMIYSFARIGAVVAMRVEDYYPGGKRWWVRLHEKGGKRHEMPAHHKLEHFLDEYLAAAGIREDGKTPLFRSAIGKTGVLATNR